MSELREVSLQSKCRTKRVRYVIQSNRDRVEGILRPGEKKTLLFTGSQANVEISDFT